MSGNHDPVQLLFSYGTLQDEKIQLELFGRRLIGANDRLRGFRIGQLQLSTGNEANPDNIQSYPVAIAGDQTDCIEGKTYQLTLEELQRADLYETKAYSRVKVQLESGISAWVYFSAV
jgi:gamma-glutamylcyclotransferase (GGCT)/AIG2-like uncharacterized protein YtfP